MDNERHAIEATAPPAGYVFDFYGNPVKKECNTCQGCVHESYDEYSSAGYSYCEKKPHMGNLKGFPFKSELKCWEIHSFFTFDWDAEI